MSSDKTNNTSSSNTKIPNDIEASFETSFADDVNGAAFKSLLKNNSSNNNTNNSNSAMTPTDQQQVHLDPLQLDINSGDRTDEGDKQPSEDLNLFISDLLEQMVSLFIFILYFSYSFFMLPLSFNHSRLSHSFFFE